MLPVFIFFRKQMTKRRKALKAFLHSHNYIQFSFRIRETLYPILFPRHCPSCGKLLPFGTLICRECRSMLPWITEPVCFKCGKLISSPEQELCYDCRQFPKSFCQGISLLLYNEKTRPIIADFKYHNRRSLSRYFAEEICYRYYYLLHRWEPGLIIPVPVHRHKRKQRGYNQAELIARDLSALTGIPYLSDLLIRSADTTPQKQLSPQARLNNLTNAFSFNKEYAGLTLSYDTVLLVDDIYTTGATMEICSRTLLAAGFKKIYICTICSGMSRD